jgi:hypothetical protein
MNPIFIPSKGRAKNATTPKILEAEGIPFTLVVETQEADLYMTEFPKAKIGVLHESNRGIGYARQQILDLCRGDKFKKYWQIDDDLIGFEFGKGKPCSAREAIDRLETLTERDSNTAISGYRWPEWGKRGRFEVNTCIYQAVLTRTDTGINYDTEGMRQDTDFILQHIVRGWSVIRYNEVAVRFPEMGFTPGGGGLSDDYRNGRFEQAAAWLHAKWPRYTTMRKYKGRMEAFVDWSLFK